MGIFTKASFVGRSRCTSKLENFEDLDSIDSLGFRGEAIYSLCRLSKCVTLQTKTVEDDVGVQVCFDNGGNQINQRFFTCAVPSSYVSLTSAKYDIIIIRKEQRSKLKDCLTAMP